MSLNFLPSSDKEELSKEQKLIALQSNSFIFLIVAGILAIIIYLNLWLLTQHNQFLEKSISDLRQSQTIKETTSLEAQIKEFNTKVKLIDSITSEQLPLSNILAELIQKIPRGISVERISIDTNQNSFELRGIAQDRTSYLSLKDSLLETNWFTEVNLPITDLLSRDTINFILQTTFSENFSTSNGL
ncbi:MAG: PilN domain-containing protein [bacterium]